MRLQFIALYFILLLGSSCQDAAPEKSTNSDIPAYPWKLVCLGDDWTIGTGLSPEAAYPALLAEKLEKKRPVKIVNAGIKGESVQGAAARVDWILQQRLNALLLAYGLEDAKNNLPLTDQIAAWDTLLGKIRRANPVLTIVVLDTGAGYRKERFPSALREIIEKHGVRTVDLELPGPDQAPELWQSDETLLSAEGQMILAEKLLPALEPLMSAQ